MNSWWPTNQCNFDYNQYVFPNPLYVDKNIQLQETFPALMGYTVQNKTLNSQHLSLYGNQDHFQIETENSVKFVLTELEKAKGQAEFNEEWFKNFLLSLGQRRYEIAKLSDESKESKNFGRKRALREDLITPISGVYLSYLDKFQKHYSDRFNSIHRIDLDVPVTPGKETRDLCFVGYWNPHINFCMPVSVVNENCSICNIYTCFWEKNDPVFKQTFLTFKEIIEDEYLTSDELKDKIADFHWLFANISPFSRGSAWCGEVLTDACWLFMGYVPTPIAQGKSLDLEAMSSNKEEFRAIYPMGYRV